MCVYIAHETLIPTDSWPFTGYSQHHLTLTTTHSPCSDSSGHVFTAGEAEDCVTLALEMLLEVKAFQVR